MSSLVLALMLSAWPLPRDAGAAEYADPASWPQEPEWSFAWPLVSFVPPGWSVGAPELEAGVGLRVDRAWSITRGSPQIVLTIIAGAQDLGDPVLARAWRLNPGEFPDAGDANGDGRLDVGDFAAAAVPDVNANGALDLEDVIAARSDGVDSDGNGRVDDLCGWDFVRDAPVTSVRDAGLEAWRQLAAPVGDGLSGVGVCPDCTLLPIVAGGPSLPAALRFAADAGVRAALLPPSDADLSAELELTLTQVGASVVLVNEGSGGLVTLPLALHPAVFVPRTLTAPPALTTAVDRKGCGGGALAGTISVTTTGCQREAAATLVGLAGLIFSTAPALEPLQVMGLLGGERADAERAVLLAEGPLPAPLTPTPKLRPAALGGLDGGVPTNDFTGSLDPDPSAAFVRLVEKQGPFEWSTALPSPNPEMVRGMLGVTELGPGSGPPRFVDLDGLGEETIVAGSPRGLLGFLNVVEALSPPLVAGRLAPALGDVDGDRVLDLVLAGDDGVLEVHSFGARPVVGFPRMLDGGLAGPPVLIQTLEGTALVTLEKDGTLVHWVTGSEWTLELGTPQVSAPAAGFIDGDVYADLAIANGTEVRVLLNGSRGPFPESWSAPSLATQALLGDLVGDPDLEVVVDRVYDARGRPILSLDGWTAPVVPPALARIDRTSNRALLQVERRADGLFELTRYDVERALRQGDSLARREILKTFGHVPSRGGFAVADVTSDRNPDVLLPTEDGLLFVVDGLGQSPFWSPLPTLGTVLSSPAIGVARDELEFAVRTTRGDLVRWLGRGLVEDIAWESAGHDRANTWNAETKLPERQLTGLGVRDPAIVGPTPCGCSSAGGLVGLGLLFLFRRRRRTC